MNEKVEKTPEQIAAENQAKADAKAAKEAAKKEAAEKRAKEREEKKAAKKVEAEQKKLNAAKARQEKKDQAKAAREANRMPEQNGVRRPKPDGLCGKAWAIFDNVSQTSGAPATIGASLIVAKEQGLNEGNVRAEYARWRKFHGITGRAPKAAPAAETAAQ